MKCRWKKTIFHKEENGYTIAAYWTDDDSVPLRARGDSYQGGFSITAVGYDLPINAHTESELVGNWIENPKYGMQYAVESSMEIVPRTREGIVGYLASGAIKGIGERLAETIFSYFGLETLEVMEHSPEKLLVIRGISEKKLQEIQTAFQKNKTFRELMVFLSPFDVSPKKVQKILEEFGGEAPEIIRKRPYRLCQIKGFGFLTTDRIARSCHALLNDPMRIAGCLSYLFKQAEERDGHLYLRQEHLVAEALEFLNQDLPNPAVTERDIQEVLYRLVLQGNIISEQGCIYTASAYEMEVETAKLAVHHLAKSLPVYEIEEELKEAQSVLGITLSQTQAEAVRMVFSNPFSIITGGPGTGKTTVLKVILYIYKKLCTGTVKLMAPTGRAARRMAESTGEREASTIHMALGLVGEDDYCLDTGLLTVSFVNIDEFSMVDMRLAYELFKNLAVDARIVLIGDADQLPSVGAGDVFREFIKCNLIPVTVLDLTYRQAEHIRIAQNARCINQNNGKLDFGTDFQFLECKGAEETAREVQRIYMQELQNSDTEQVQVLTPYRKRGAASVNELNKVLRELVNPKVSGAYEMTVGRRTFRKGDKVLQTKNKDWVSNGDMGRIQCLFLDQDGHEKAEILFSGNRKVVYGVEDMEEIELAYATTIHKSQGSEYPVVILPWIQGFYTMLKRPILYTAVTRAKCKLILIGEKSALYRAIHTDDNGYRNTKLADRIQQEYRLRCGENRQANYKQLKLAI